MKCPFCNKSESQVIESRPIDDGTGIRRRRECLKCNKRYTTRETIKGNTMWVIKKDGRREAFEKEKIKRGILRAVEKRPISMNLVDSIVDDIERDMLKKEKEEVSSRLIGKAVMTKLKKIDKVAWLRFASVYLEFEGLDDFEDVLDR